MAHKRSKTSHTRRKIKSELKILINQMAWRDSMKAETINLATYETLRDYGYETYGAEFSCSYIPPTERGDVLSDGYGTGVMQLLCRHGTHMFGCGECAKL